MKFEQITPENNKNHSKTNKKMIGYLFLCAILVVLSYYFIDKKLSLWMYHNIQENIFVRGVTYLPNFFVYLSVVLGFGIFAFSPLRVSNLNQHKLRTVIITTSFSAYLAIVLTKVLKFIFGRIGPSPWINHNFNPAYYGFFPFHGYASAYQDFPSGHTMATFAIISVIYFAYPKFRWIYLFVGLSVIMSLLSTQSHFFSDCLAGVFLGSMIGYFTARFFELTNP